MKKLLVVSDLHIGSDFALMPPKVTEGEGDVQITHGHSKAQAVLWREWVKMCKDVGEVDDMVINGDITDGPNVKENGLGVWTSNANTAIRVACGLITMAKAKRYHIVYGSGYHVGSNPNADALVGEKLKDGKYDVTHGYELALEYKDEGRRYHFAHGIGVSQVFNYRTTAIARELMIAVLNQKQLGKYHGVFRGHAHYFVSAEYPNSFGMVVPGWKLRDIYGTKRGFGITPRCGYVLLEVYKGGENKTKYIFSPPRSSTLVEKRV